MTELLSSDIIRRNTAVDISSLVVVNRNMKDIAYK